MTKDTNTEIKALLQDHEKRIAKLESVLSNSKMPKIKKGKQSLPKHIMELRDNGFISQPKTAEEIHEKLEASYPCVLNRVEVALIRLCERRHLRKAAKKVSGKSCVAYVW